MLRRGGQQGEGKAVRATRARAPILGSRSTVEESIHDAQQLVRREDGGVGVEGQRGGLVFTACAADQGTCAVSGVTVLGG